MRGGAATARPFALSLSKPCTFLAAVKKEGQRFERLSANGDLQ
jgi:hypothetical protein